MNMNMLTIRQLVKLVGPSQYRVTVDLYDANGDHLSTIESDFERTNEIFPAYKSFQHAITAALRRGATHLRIETNVNSFASELSGKPNRNGRLYTQTMERLRGIEISFVGLIEGGAASVGHPA